MSLDQVVVLLEHFTYLILFPLAIIEGPIVTVIAGFLVATQVLNGFVVYAIVVAGDVVGDTLWYSVGRYSHSHIARWLERFFAIPPEKITHAKERIVQHRFRTISIFKLTQGVGFAGLVATGMARVPYPLFISACAVISVTQVAFFPVLGIFFGSAYESIGGYFNEVAFASCIVAVLTLGYYTWKHKKEN